MSYQFEIDILELLIIQINLPKLYWLYIKIYFVHFVKIEAFLDSFFYFFTFSFDHVQSLIILLAIRYLIDNILYEPYHFK